MSVSKELCRDHCMECFSLRWQTATGETGRAGQEQRRSGPQQCHQCVRASKQSDERERSDRRDQDREEGPGRQGVWRAGAQLKDT